MSILGVGAGAVGGTGFYPQTIDQSLRFDGSTSKLEKTPSSDGNRKKWTSSWWVKRSKLGALQYMWSGASYSGNDGIAAIYFNSDDKIHMYFDSSGSSPYGAINSRVYRDTTNWYHFVWAVDAANTVAKLWVNGVEETVGITPPNYDYGMNKASTKMAFGVASWGGSPNYDGYCAEFVHLDGQYLDETSFGEFKNGVWVPKDIHAQGFTFGTNGFYLPFSDSSNIGYDYQTTDRSTTNDYTATGLASTDIVPDSPTNNFATLLGLRSGEGASSQTFSEGNLQWTSSSHAYNATGSSLNIPTTGKWYMEVYVKTAGSSLSHDFGLGIQGVAYDSMAKQNPPTATYGDSTIYVTRRDSASRIEKNLNNVLIGNTYSYNAGDIVSIAYDADNGKVYYGLNNVFWAEDGGTDGNPSSGTNHSTTLTTGVEYFFILAQYSNTYVSVTNFGADSSFAGNKTSGSANGSDANGIGDFYYDPPTGFLALCTDNLPDTTLSPSKSEQASDNMNVITYTGDGASSRSLTGVGFQPDLIWYKHRSIGYGHVIYDSSRGTGEAHQRSDASIADGAYNDLYGTLTSFDSDGITVAKGDDASAPDAFFNTNSQTVVGWNWKCGGTAPTKTYKVVVVSDSGNKYRFRNSADSATFAQSGVTLNLQEGGTYVFDWSDSSAQGHPFRFSTTSDGTHGGGSEYTTGVVKDDSAYTTTITVASSAPQLYFYCSIHSGMGGSVNTNSTFGSTNFDGSLKSIVQSNETAGFSIVKYTGNGTDPSGGTITLGHGLTSTPEIIFHKNRDSATAGNNYWTVWTPFHAGTNMSFLSFTSNNTGGWNDTPMSSAVFSPPISNYGNVNNEDYICYLWHSVEGYSKIGAYEMNYNSDGTYVFCGFRPRFLVTKPIDQAGSWSVYDSARDPFNDGDANMSQWENATTEASFANSAVDFLSNGFKLRHSSDGYSNIASNTAIFMAFAEIPAKFANAV